MVPSERVGARMSAGTEVRQSPVSAAAVTAASRYDRTVTVGVIPSRLARRANFRSSNVAMLAQAL